jgi:hypothetical protein
MTYYFGATICQRPYISNFITKVALLSFLFVRCVPQNRPLILTMNPDNAGCDACMCLLQKTDRRHNAFAWAVLWICPICEKHFYCCDDSRCCTRSVIALSSRQQITRHNYNWHKKTRLHQIVDPLPATDSNDVIIDMADDSVLGRLPIPTNALGVFAVHPPTKRFFEDLQQHSFSFAVKGLVARCCYQDAKAKNFTYPPISDDDVALFFRIARLVFKTGAQHQHLLGAVLAGFEMRFSSPVISNNMQTTSCLPLPTTQKAFVATLLNPTNQNSLTSIIPRPPIVVSFGRHAYVSIPALLAYELGLAHALIDSPYNPKYERLVNSPHGKKLFNRAKANLLAEATTIDNDVNSYQPYVVLFLMWFDGWDPNSSSKGNRSPVWSGTLTMVFLDMLGSIVSVSTYPFAAGPGKADHDIIFREILKDLRCLQRPLVLNETSARWHYSRAAHTMALLYGELFCIWQDQPARRQETNTLGGNSKNHSIFGISCYVTKLRKEIPACAQCRAATIQYLKDGNFVELFRPNCSLCTNWLFPSDPLSSIYRSPISKDFPSDAVVGKDFNIGGGALDFTTLRQAWHEACQAVTDGRWSDTTTILYLKTLCVNEATIKAMINQCRNHVLWTEMGEDPESYDPQTLASYRKQFAANPARFQIPEPPAAWFLGTLGLHVETIMHLAGGVQKAVAKFVHRYATTLGNGPALTVRLAFPIALLHKYCRVQYLPLAAYSTDKFGGWVMENYKSLCKLAPWLYRCFEDKALQPPKPFVEPTKPRKKWTQKENIAYLRSRGIDAVEAPTNMYAVPARQAVDVLFSRPGGPPDVVVHPSSGVTPRDMRRLWLSCSTMFKHLMRLDHDAASRNQTDARVRAFLSEIESLDSMLQPLRTKPLYLAKYNFPSLLRAVDHLWHFGNIRDLHEGGIEGEAMVKQLRPLVTNGLKDKFATHLLRKAFRDYTIDRLLVNLDHQADPEATTDESSWVSNSIDDAIVGGIHHISETEEESLEQEAVESIEREALEAEPDPYPSMRHVLAEPDDNEQISNEQTKLLFRRYNSRATVQQYFAQGIPISVVITNQKATQRLGVIVSKCNQWWLLPLSIGDMRFDDDLGFTYFHVTLHPTEEQVLVQTKDKGKTVTDHIHLLNYATLLPALWEAPPIPYALLTMEGQHLDADLNFV